MSEYAITLTVATLLGAACWRAAPGNSDDATASGGRPVITVDSTQRADAVNSRLTPAGTRYGQAEVLLYAAPSGRPDTARAYAEAALVAGAAFVNTTSDAVARDPSLLARFHDAGLPLIGDDRASQFGSSVLHRALLELLRERGITLVSSYQVNLGGTEDFGNLVDNPNTKKQSKVNALGSDRVQLAPLGYLPHLQSQKVSHVSIEAEGWGETPVSLEVRLKVHDPSGAAVSTSTCFVPLPSPGGRGAAAIRLRRRRS